MQNSTTNSKCRKTPTAHLQQLQHYRKPVASDAKQPQIPQSGCRSQEQTSAVAMALPESEPLAVSWSHWTCVLLAFCSSRCFISDTTWFQRSWRALPGSDQCALRSMHTTEAVGAALSDRADACHTVFLDAWCGLLPAAAFKLRIQEPVREGRF